MSLRLFVFGLVRTADEGRGAKPLPRWLTWLLPKVLTFVGRKPRLRTALSRLLINSYAYATTPRPRAFSMASDYTSWHSLTDRSFTGRHLPPVAEERDLPSPADVLSLYRREREVQSTDTSVLFMFFAQWFTDGFLRTSQDLKPFPARNTSTQEIDLNQIYGLDATKTKMLRSTRGRLKSQRLNGAGDPDPNGGEYPQYLYEHDGVELVIKPEFRNLHDQVALDRFVERVPRNKDRTFAVGLEYGNSTIGHTILNTTFLREHNRIAGELAAAHPEWGDDDDRIFETARNVMIVLLLKLVIEEYIKHIAPFDFPLEAVPYIADGERWNRSNWVSIEFDLLYRWHSLVPDAIDIGTMGSVTADNFVNNNPLVFTRGLEGLVSDMSHQLAGRIGLQNTPEELLAPVEVPTIAMMRKSRLPSFNAYRKAFGLKPLRNYEQLTTDPELRARLQQLYGDIDNLEWYVGIFAEDYPDFRMMGKLMTTMVAYDAFTQALTNPLLAPNVFNENTFSKEGLEIITNTTCLQQIIARNSSSPGDVYASFNCG